MSEEFKQDKKRMQKMIDNSKSNADSLGISFAVVLSWAITTYSGAVVPPEVIAALSGVIGAFAARMKDKF